MGKPGNKNQSKISNIFQRQGIKNNNGVINPEIKGIGSPLKQNGVKEGAEEAASQIARNKLKGGIIGSGIAARKKKKEMVNIDGESQPVAREDLEKRGVEALPSHPKNRLKRAKPGSWERRAVYDDLNWKHDHTIPKTIGEKASSAWQSVKQFGKKHGKEIAIGMGISPLVGGPYMGYKVMQQVKKHKAKKK